MNVPIWGGIMSCFGAALRACGALHRMNVPVWGGVLYCFGAALRACGALPRAPACWERSANRVVTASHAEAFGTPRTVYSRDHSVPVRHWVTRFVTDILGIRFMRGILGHSVRDSHSVVAGQCVDSRPVLRRYSECRRPR